MRSDPSLFSFIIEGEGFSPLIEKLYDKFFLDLWVYKSEHSVSPESLKYEFYSVYWSFYSVSIF